MASPIPEPPSNMPAKQPDSVASSEKGADLLDHQLPPSYAPYVQQPYPGQPTPVLPHFYVCPAQQQQQQPNRRRRILRRFIFTVVFAVTIWALVSALVRSVMVVTHFNATFEDWPTEEDFPIPPELKRVRCVWGDETPDRMPLKASYKQILKAPLTFPFKKEEKFELPIDSKTLFFLSRGVYSGGQVKVVTTDKESDVATVKVHLDYLRPGGPKIAKVCQFTRDDGENGIGIFTPNEPQFPRHHGLRFYVTIKLPKSKSSELLHIKKFETDLPNFTQVFRKVGKHVVFDDISLKGANGGILGGYLVAGKGSIETSNGPVSVDLSSYGPFYIASHNGGILGVFNVTGSLALKTLNERIKGVVFLNPDTEGTATLDLITKNTVVNLDVALNAFHKDAKGGNFDISAITSNSPVSLRIREAPVDSTLFVNVSASHAPAELVLPPTYEGDFEVTTVRFWPTVLANPYIRDPSGEGRKRDVLIEKEGNHVNGRVSWSEEGQDRGHVELSTSHSPAVLRL